MDQIKLGGAALLALGLCFAACEKQDDSTPPTQQSGSSGTGTAGSTMAPSEDSPGGGGADGTEPVRLGERGSSCDSAADCADGLTCIATHDCPANVECSNKSCQPSNFNLMGTGKSCHIIDCATKKDCCGDMPEQAPSKCANRDVICSQPTMPGCTTGLTCTLGSTTCGKGTCTSRCNYDGKACVTTGDCAPNTCDPVTHYCSLTGLDCTTTACAVTNTCTATPVCVCTNPLYMPSDSICTDADCEGICGFTCKDDRCVVDNTCLADVECPATTPFCASGACVECKADSDCDDEKCIKGHCGPACKADSQCALFEACTNGECVHVGCRSDRECVLEAAGGEARPSQDPRLAKCDIAGGIGTCVMPCDIDAQCSPTEVCLAGVCKYIGCDTDSECKTIAGLHDLPVPTPERPWSTTAVCKAEDAAAP